MMSHTSYLAVFFVLLASVFAATTATGTESKQLTIVNLVTVDLQLVVDYKPKTIIIKSGGTYVIDINTVVTSIIGTTPDDYIIYSRAELQVRYGLIKNFGLKALLVYQASPAACPAYVVAIGCFFGFDNVAALNTYIATFKG